MPRKSNSRPRAAVCVRPRDNRRSAALQMRACSQLAKAQGWRVVAVILDEAPAVGGLMSAATASRLDAKEFDAVVVPLKTGAPRIVTRQGR